MKYQNRITIDTKIMHGQPVIKGTRIFKKVLDTNTIIIGRGISKVEKNR